MFIHWIKPPLVFFHTLMKWKHETISDSHKRNSFENQRRPPGPDSAELRSSWLVRHVFPAGPLDFKLNGTLEEDHWRRGSLTKRITDEDEDVWWRTWTLESVWFWIRRWRRLKHRWFIDARRNKKRTVAFQSKVLKGVFIIFKRWFLMKLLGVMRFNVNVKCFRLLLQNLVLIQV